MEEIINEHNKKEYPPMHTAEHILNGTMVKMWGCKRSCKSHVEREKSKLDYVFPRALTSEEIKSVEDRVNEVIQSDLPVIIEYATQEEVRTRFDMVRLPDNASDTVRIVKIGDYDECLCAGDHVRCTGEIGTFRITSSRYQDGMLRLVFRLGQ